MRSDAIILNVLIGENIRSQANQRRNPICIPAVAALCLEVVGD